MIFCAAPCDRSAAAGPPLLMDFSLRLAQLIKPHGNNDDDADDDFLDISRPAHLVGAVPQHRHDQCSDHRAENTAASPAEARTPDNDRGDDVQLKAVGYG